MFIRLKRLKGRDYAYLVKNRWTKNGPRQKTRKYLGRCEKLEKVRDASFSEYCNSDVGAFVARSSLKTVLARALEVELIKHGFRKEKGVFVKGGIAANPKKLKIYDKEIDFIAEKNGELTYVQQKQPRTEDK